MAKPSITIVDHKINNLASITNACRALGMDLKIAHHPEDLLGAGHVLLPGVGHFGASMAQLETTGLGDAIRAHVGQGKPFMGICLGFQVLFESGTEGGQHRGLSLFEGEVRRFETELHVPHVGWNSVELAQSHPLFSGVESGSYLYFVHSYFANQVADSDVLTRTDYGSPFVSAVAKGSAVGTQFHPEKSGATGLRLLHNFSNWRP